MLNHAPVMLNEVIAFLKKQPQIESKTKRPFALYIDATFGRGGYTRAVLENFPHSKLIAFDQDPDAQTFAEQVKQDYPDRFHLAPVNFSLMEEYLTSPKVQAFEPSLGADGILFDLGVSSPQLDDNERGFSFRKDGPLDMRMSKKGVSAAEFINNADEKTIANILYLYGEEKKSRPIARAIIRKREEKPIQTTFELKSIIHSVIKPSYKTKIDPATRSFQAIRIHINQELKALKLALLQSERILRPSGRLICVSFHSLEDRIIKKFIQSCSTKSQKDHFSYQVPSAEKKFYPSFLKQTTKPLSASAEEIKENPRARSAKLRAAERTEHPPIAPTLLSKEGGRLNV